MRRAIAAVFVLLCLGSAALAVEDPVFSAAGIPSNYAPARMDPRVPTPEKVLGFRIGDRFATHSEVAAYVRAVAAAAPDRVRVETYGKTPEGRDLLLVVVTAPENLARLEDLSGKIRALYLPAPAKSASPPAGLPLFVWFSYGVHGDEASSPDAAMATLYHLAASRDSETLDVLRRVVLTMDPMVNPDGRMRYLAWLSTAVTGSPDPNPDAREHHPAWPRGRTNHFGFDLNRDWAWVTQTETRARIARYLRTPPQVHVDFHEMSPESSYFFPPSAEPLHAGLQRDSVRWLSVFGRENASAFDARGWTYFVRETFDLFYPAYGDSWPFFNGAIGMTYEMAGGPGGGLAYRRRDGSILTLKERALKHFTTSLTTLKTAAAHREELLRDFASARAASLAAADRYYVLSADQDPYRLRLFLDTLSAQGIQVKRSRGSGKDGGGALVIEAAQPSGALAAALLDEKAELPAKFLEEERTKFLRREDEGFYDVTAWSLPTAFGLRASRVSGRAPASDEAQIQPGRVEHSGARLGYLVRSPGLAAFPILARCLQARVVASVSAKSFRLGGGAYAVGTLFLHRAGAPPELDSIVADLARETSVDFVGVDSAWTDEGIALGSERFVPWKPARVGLLTGPGIDRSSAGWALDEFYRVFRYPVSVLDVDSFDEAELARYDAIILPDASARIASELAKESGEALRAWVKAGGVLVGIGGGAALLREKDVGLSQAAEWKAPREKQAEKKGDEAASSEKKSAAKPTPADEADIENRRIRIPGAIFRTRGKSEHFLLFGSPDSPRVLLGTDAPLVPPPDPFQTVVSIEREKPLASGHAWPEAIERMSGTPYLIAEPAGKGWAITFLDDPNFRGFWLGTSLLFGNAAILAPSFQP